MILHCYFCALGGDRPSETSRVAIVDEKTFSKPLRADMFKPLNPQHDTTPPFMSDEWRYMYHRACGRYPWPYDVDRIHGPNRILTDKGFVEIPDDAVIDSVVDDLPDIGPDDDALPNTCDVCGKVCKSPLGLNSHKRSHK